MMFLNWLFLENLEGHNVPGGLSSDNIVYLILSLL